MEDFKTTHSRLLATFPALVALAWSLSGSGVSAARSPLQIVAIEYRDLDGDRDRFPDTGETGRIVLALENRGASLTNLTLYLTTGDPDVACITGPLLTLSAIAAGATVTVGSLDPAEPGFAFKAGDALQTINPADPARIDFCLRAKAQEIDGILDPMCFSVAADLDLPGIGGSPVDGPDGLPGTADDGLVLETFDLDRDGDGRFTVRDTFGLRDDGTGLTSSGSYLRVGDPSMGTGVLDGVACGGFLTPAEGNAACILDPDYPMDWHLHCVPGATGCPNLETGPCVGGCSYQTPADGQKAISPPNSLHMGAHFDPVQGSLGDTTHLRTLQAFVSAPLNLTLFPRPGDLVLSMFHIARLVDNNGVSGSQGKCVDCGDVQLQRDVNPDPATDAWGPWEKLVPFQNVYDHIAGAWSVFLPIYCKFTPTDTGTEPPAPRGVRETMCHPTGVWSSCGSARGTSPLSTFQCPGPGFVDPSGTGVWVETKFNLAPSIGQRIRLRWIGATWVFDVDGAASSYYEYGGSWGTTGADDGWWLDDLSVTGVVTRQGAPLADDRAAAPGVCPVPTCAGVPPGVVSWWPLDGDTTDIAGGSDGTLGGGAGFAPGQVGGALDLDGTDDEMTTPLLVDYAQGVTFEAWIRSRAQGGGILEDRGSSPGPGAQLQITRGEVLFLVDPPAGGTRIRLVGGQVADGLFHHVAATWTGDTAAGGARLFVDGVLAMAGTATFTLSTGSAPLAIGFGFDGWIDEVGVYGHPLSADEIRALYTAGSSGKCRGPCVDDDGDGYGFPWTPDCPAGGTRSDCNDANPAVHPDAVEVCDGIDNDCDGTLPEDEADADNDGWLICEGDCDDADPALFPGSLEFNDGEDNDCPGSPGYGLVDEIDTLLAEDTARFCWPAQPGATSYQVARAVLSDFTGTCWLITTTDTCLTETLGPPVVYFYLVRALTPYAGSWGADSSGVERTNVCGQ